MTRPAVPVLRRPADDRGTITILLVGVLVVILGVMAVGVAVTGVHLERNRLQNVADGAALAASQAYRENTFYDGSGDADTDPPGPDVPTDVRPPTSADASAAARRYLERYPPTGDRTRDVTVSSVQVGADGSVTVELRAVTDPPLIDWVTRSGLTSVPLTVTSTARSR
jgi:Flp pilus assembly protein TadG